MRAALSQASVGSKLEASDRRRGHLANKSVRRRKAATPAPRVTWGFQSGRHKRLGLFLVLLAGCAATPSTRHTTPRPGVGFPETREFYPTESKAQGEAGGPAVRACIDANGVLTAPVTLVRSSGSERLDKAGLALASAGSGHYQPATDDGKPVPECFVYRILFAPQPLGQGRLQ